MPFRIIRQLAWLSFLGAGFFQVPAGAEPRFPAQLVTAVGQYSYRGAYTVDSHQRFEIFTRTSDEAEERYLRLEREGYRCLTQSQDRAVCALRLAPNAQDPQLLEKMPTRFAGYRVRLSEAFDPVLLVNSETLRQWSVSQKIFVGRMPELRMYSHAGYSETRGQTSIYPGAGENPESDQLIPTSAGMDAPWVLQIEQTGGRMDKFVVRAHLIAD